ncbi:prolyl oligopeptidase family serine peptidase [Lentzea sp. NPDC003310]|uniref:prolyl oligopeptidase family serine peptidase n=1 Tax=Lentzea sp. NPDC003310 TaxID=3154447 RepID=UPI0033AD79F1
MRTAPYGSWTSPITEADVAASEALVEYVGFAGGEVWWVETRPDEGGRGALVRWRDGIVSDVLGPQWNVRTRIIEYGGRPWLALADGGVVFTHWDDQRVYRARPGAEPVPLSPEPELPAGDHFADFSVVGDEVWCVRESMYGPAETDVRRDLVALPLDGSGEARVLVHSHHFMTGPKVSPDGAHVVWLGWDHPTMPWETTDLMCAPVRDGEIGEPRRIAGGGTVSVGQVEWAPDRSDTLYLLSDPDGWWNVHELTLGGATRSLCRREEEFGEALWRIGARWFLPVGGGRVFVVHGTSGRQLAVLEADGTLRDIGGPYTEWAHIATDGSRVAATAASPRHRRTVVLADPETAAIDVVRPAPVQHAEYLPTGTHQVFHGPDGEDVHAFVYPPHNPDFTAPQGELPPFLVHVHGGPTSRSQLVVNQEIAYFTSRGIGVVDVQYGGSTGFGRAYRERLRGNWGLVDVRDCATAARGLIAQGVADPARIGIRGGSAGGWTSTASLSAEPDLYRVAGIYFPVLDPVEWRVRGTHDFESRYLDSLIGPWPQAKSRYEELSPLERADGIRAPFVLLQGTEDAICPPAQAELLLAKLRSRDVPHSYLTFEGEQHGFRKTDTIVSCLRAELALYASVLGFERKDQQ